MLDLAHIRKLAERAQPGPWCVTNSLPDKSLRTEAGWEVCYFPYSDALANMDFIAAARELVPAMADEIERLRQRVDQLLAITNPHIAESGEAALGHLLTSARGEIERLRRELDSERAELQRYRWMNHEERSVQSTPPPSGEAVRAP